jgi:hypothetical protein
MSAHRYTVGALGADYARAGLGVAVCAGPLLFVETTPVIFLVLGGLSCVFLSFGVRTGLRQASQVVLTEDAIAVSGPMGFAISWRDVGRVSLRYYSTRRDRTAGWMQLSLKARPGTGRWSRKLNIDSDIDGFAEIVRRAMAMAARHGVPLSPATLTNLESLGVPAPEGLRTQDDGAAVLPRAGAGQ